MREGGLDQAMRAAGPVGARTDAAGAVSPRHAENRVDPSHVPSAVQPSLGSDAASPELPGPTAGVDEVDLLRSHEYGLLALLFGRSPTADVLARVSQIKGDASPLGLAHIQLAQAAAAANPDAVSREFFDLFIGVARGELLPYGSYYLTGFLHERPLARVREDLARLGVERVEEQREPEDHIAILCEVMAGLADGRFGASPDSDRIFFDRHLKPWAVRFFADCETARHGGFYRAAGTVGRLFMEIEAQAFAMDA